MLFNFAQAQTANNGSPYSRFGLGDLQPFNQIYQRGMGGIAMGGFDPLQLNIANPAGLAGLRLTTFEFAAAGTVLDLRSSTQRQATSNFNLNYFAFGFPISQKWATAIGFIPFTNTNYAINTRVDSAFSSWNEFYNGSGGINRVFWSHGYSINQQWHIGATANFLFGTLNQERRIEFADSLNTFNLRVQDQVRISDANFQLGVQYRKSFQNGNKLHLGVVAEMPAALNASSNFIADRFTYGRGTLIVRDTVSRVPEGKGNIQLPLALSFGGQYEIGTRWLYGFDVRWQDWSKYRYFDNNDSLKNSLQFAGGLQYRPNAQAVSKADYLKTVAYRAGFRYHNSYLQLRDQSIDEIGITLGASFPIRRSNAGVHLAYETGLRGTTRNGLIREQYHRIALSFTLNDRWFIKRKYD